MARQTLFFGFPNYGLKRGEVYDVSKNIPERHREAEIWMTGGNGTPWASMERVKMRVVAEYPSFVRFAVLPHVNPFGMGVASEEYCVSTHKHDIMTNAVKIYEVTGNE